MRTWTIDKGAAKPKTFNGFNLQLGSNSKRVALVREEDTIDVFALDDGPEPVAELIRYLQYKGMNSTLIGVFSREADDRT